MQPKAKRSQPRQVKKYYWHAKQYLSHASYLVGNVSSESLATCKNSRWTGGSASPWRMGTHGRDPQPEQRTIYREFLPVVRAQPQKAGRSLLENPRTTSNALPRMLRCPLAYPSTTLSLGTFHVKLLFCQWSAIPSFTPQWLPLVVIT